MLGYMRFAIGALPHISQPPSPPQKEPAMSAFTGIWVPLITPFQNGEVDLPAAQKIADELIKQGVHGLVVCGTTGEAAALDEAEQSALLSAISEVAAQRCPVAMGISGSNTRAVAEKVKRCNRHAPAAYLLSAPSYVRPSQQGILWHFQAVAAQTDSPIIIYNIPARTGVNIEASTIAALAADARFVAVKESSGQVAQIKELIADQTLKVLSGDDGLLLSTLTLGGHGAISAAAHIRPDLFVRLYELVKAGKTEEAALLFNALLPLIRLLFAEPNPGPLKAALALQGKLRETLRLPMTPMSAAGKAKLAAELETVMAL
ncbi:4-hydroxy-tetrahydrodipicolinate synthase [compost metagenome]